MALARIFSRYPEHTTELCRQLQEQGYDVEVMSPEEASPTAADLEIQMEACDPADVLRRAGELASQANADIAVAPGVLTLVCEDVGPALPSVLPAPAPDPPTMAEATTVTQVAEVYEVHEPQAATPSFLIEAARALGAWLAVGLAGVCALLAAGGAGFRELWERFRVRAAEIRARRQAALLELTRRRLDAGRRAVDLEGVRRATDLVLLQQNDADWPPGSPATRTPVRAGNGRIWRIATRPATLAGTALLAACFAVGLVVATFHSRPPAPSGQGVTVQGAAAKTAETLPREAQPKAEPPRPSPVLKPKPAAQTRRASRNVARQHDDAVANDVVVRHLAPPKPTPRAQANGWKHFSDMNN